MIVLGIETSCDETAASVVDGAAVPAQRIRANVVLSQLGEHAPHGGVVPEIAARAHLQHLDGLIQRALREADVALSDLKSIAATGGPGLIGGVIVGVMTAKAIASALKLPFLAVNHLEAHALTARLTDDLAFPYLLLLVSGGHCQLLSVEGVGRYRRYGTTVDDAAGEAFDKVAKLIGLAYPGGPAVERAALNGDPKRFALPRPMKGRPGCDFSFSGLKTAVRHAVAALPEQLSSKDRDDVAASFQAAVAEVMEDRSTRAMQRFLDEHSGIVAPTLVVSGGVAANQYLRGVLTRAAQKQGFKFLAPPPKLCTDNAAMIAWAGFERLRLGLTDGLDFAPRPRWPLEELSA